MIEFKSAKDFSRLRRIALTSQGLFGTSQFGTGMSGARRAIEHIGYVQLDTISVVERAHNHVLYSRVPEFKSADLNELLANRSIFEYWSHAAAFLPVQDFRFSLPYKNAIKNGKVHWYKSPDKKLMKEVKARIRAEGPLRSRDFESTSSRKNNAWWDRKPTKKALEQLFMEGDLMVHARDGFQKVYDLSERVLPADIDRSPPSTEEFAAHLVQQQLRCHGFVTMKGVCYLRRSTALRKAVKKCIEDGVLYGELESFRLPTGEVFFIEVGKFEQRIPRARKQLSILSPFDNVVIQRDRLKALFHFDYQIECYVPEVKRKFGYFCLPLLLQDEFVGRMDCKVHRKDRALEIKALHVEKNSVDEPLFLKSFAKALKSFMSFQACDFISAINVYPKRLEKPVRAELKQFM